jgi:hypothetical protein
MPSVADVPVTKLDATFGRPELATVRDAAARGDWAALAHALTVDVIDGEDRSDRIDIAAETIAEPLGKRTLPALQEWVRSEPRNPTALLLAGAVEVLRAWQVRGARLA